MASSMFTCRRCGHRMFNLESDEFCTFCAHARAAAKVDVSQGVSLARFLEPVFPTRIPAPIAPLTPTERRDRFRVIRGGRR